MSDEISSSNSLFHMEATTIIEAKDGQNKESETRDPTA